MEDLGGKIIKLLSSKDADKLFKTKQAIQTEFTKIYKMEAKKETFIKTLIESFGNISKACTAVGISRRTYYNWVEKDKEFKNEVDNISEFVIDEVENHLFDQIKDGSTAATIFYLKTKGKHRGYVEKQEHDHTTKGEAINTVTWNFIDAEKKDQMNVLKEMKPMYFDDYLICDLFGGRAGARSYSMTQYGLYGIEHSTTPFRAFFLREVHSTIYSSMWQDFKDRIDEYEEIHQTSVNTEYSDNKNGENHAINRATGNTITTKGFRVSSGTHTANLKSLAAATHIFIDEADEVTKDDFLKLRLSLRKKGVDLKIIRAFNPPHKDHWIWGDYELEKVTNDELLQMLMRTSSIPTWELEQMANRNTKTYFKAKPKAYKHIAINTNHINNWENLNPDAVIFYDETLRDDFHYYVVNILGLIPNEAGDIVYYEYDRFNSHTDRTVQAGDVLHVGMDFNVTNMSAVIHVVDGDTAHAVEEAVKIFDTHQMCSVLKERFSGHRIIIYPDASGRNRHSNSGKSDFDTIREHGFEILVDTQNPPVRDRINIVNNQFRKKKYLVNRYNCPSYSESLRKLKYKGGEPDKSSGYDHQTDAGGYFVHNQFNKPKPMKATFSVGRLRK